MLSVLAGVALYLGLCLAINWVLIRLRRGR